MLLTYSHYTYRFMETLETQLYGIAKGIKQGSFEVSDVGDIVPASLMLQELDGILPIGCSYMNKWGCEHLGTCVEEINELGSLYYDRYFVEEEMHLTFEGIRNYLAEGDFNKQYNFFQRVKLYGDKDYTWFYTVCKLLSVKTDTASTNKLVVISSPLMGMDKFITRINKTLEQDTYIRSHYRKFALLTNREKEIISLLANGKSTKEVAEQLFLSPHTVSTHRKNLIYKIECHSFAELLRFAMAFDLV